MMPRTVRLSRATVQPWKNGGGTTRELLAWPTAENWTLRVSVATVERDGPFSAFPGVTRWFTVVAGRGVRLALPTGGRILRMGDAPACFPGEAAPDCLVLDGPTDDLNLMARNQPGVEARLSPAKVGSELAMPGHRWRALYTQEGASLRMDTTAKTLKGATLGIPAQSLVWSDAADGPTWTLAAGVAAWWLVLAEAPAPAPSPEPARQAKRK